MVDLSDDTMANVLAAIINKASMGGGPATSITGSPTPILGSAQTAGQSIIDQATQRSSTATTAPTGTPQASSGLAPGADAVGLNNPAVAQGYGGETGHPGIDLSVPVGTPLVAAESGTVTAAGLTDPGGYGNEVEITAPDGTVMRYGHLSSVDVHVGDQIQRGAPIGKSGGAAGAPGSGNSTGPHLHFEVRQGDHSVDPVPYLAGQGGIVQGSATGNPAAKAVGNPEVSQAMNIVDIAEGKPGSHNAQTDQTGQQTGTGSTSDTDPGAVDAFLAATRQHESGGDYTIYNQSGQSNASGAYQFLGSTWRGLGGSTANAAEASPAEQDRIARAYAMQLFNQFHSWRLVAIAWYGGPGVAEQVAAGQNPGSPEGQGSYLAYGDTIAQMMAGGGK